MQTTLTETGPFERLLTVRLDEAELAAAKSRAATKLAGELKIKGFRPGKAPVPLVERAVGAERLRTEALEEALPEIVGSALEEAEINPATVPAVSDTRDEGGAIEVDITVTLWPTIDELPDYEGRRIEVDVDEVDDADVDAQVDRLRDQFAELEDVERPAGEGDYVLVDLSATRDGESVDEASATDFLYEVGSGAFLDGLDDAVTGASAGSIEQFDTELPDGFGDLAGPVRMQVLVKGVRAKRLPEIDDDWVSDVSELDTVAELRDSIREELRGVMVTRARGELQERLLEVLVREADIDLPEQLVNAEMDDTLRSLLRRLEAQGLGLDVYLQVTGKDQDTFVEELREQAQRNLGARVLLGSVVESADIEVDAEEVDATISALAQSAGEDAEEFRNALVGSGQVQTLVGDMLRQKALEHLVRSAEPVDSSGAPLDLFPESDGGDEDDTPADERDDGADDSRDDSEVTP